MGVLEQDKLLSLLTDNPVSRRTLVTETKFTPQSVFQNMKSLVRQGKAVHTATDGYVLAVKEEQPHVEERGIRFHFNKIGEFADGTEIMQDDVGNVFRVENLKKETIVRHGDEFKVIE